MGISDICKDLKYISGDKLIDLHYEILKCKNKINLIFSEFCDNYRILDDDNSDVGVILFINEPKNIEIIKDKIFESELIISKLSISSNLPEINLRNFLDTNDPVIELIIGENVNKILLPEKEYIINIMPKINKINQTIIIDGNAKRLSIGSCSVDLKLNSEQLCLSNCKFKFNKKSIVKNVYISPESTIINLPKNLETLSIPESDDININVKKLIVHNYNKKFIFPENLETLIISRLNCLEFFKIPESCKNIEIKDVLKKNIKYSSINITLNDRIIILNNDKLKTFKKETIIVNEILSEFTDWNIKYNCIFSNYSNNDVTDAVRYFFDEIMYGECNITIFIKEYNFDPKIINNVLSNIIKEGYNVTLNVYVDGDLENINMKDIKYPIILKKDKKLYESN